MKAVLTTLLAICVCLVIGCGEPKATPSGDRQPMPKDFKSLKTWAEKGDAEAQSNLGVMYDTGEGVEQDFKEAVYWYQKAADQGYELAQSNLGLMYGDGVGVEQNDVTAYAWWNIATTNGNQSAKNIKSVIAGRMTPFRIAEAEALAKEMIKKNPKLIKKKE